MTRTKLARFLAIAVCSLFLCSTAFAQPGMDLGFFGDDDGPCKGGAEGQKGETKELLATVYLMELTKELALTKEQALDVSAIIDKDEKAKKEHQQAVHEALREITDELAKDNPSEKDLKNWIDAVSSARDKMKESESKTRDAIFAKLSVTQQAKFMVFHIKWMRKLHRIREHIEGERMRKGMRGGPDGPMPGGPGPVDRTD